MNNFRITTGLAILAFASVSHAVILTQDTWTPLTGSTALTGLVLEDDVQAFSFNNGITGTVQHRVVRAADNTLSFAWRVVRTDFISTSLVRSFRIGSFYTSTYDADWKSDGLGTRAANFGYLFSDPDGSAIFSFTDTAGGGGSALLAQESSRFFYFDTDATEYARTASFDMTAKDGSDFFYTVSKSTFAPVPEPASMIALGLGAVVLMRRRKRKA